MLKIRDIVVHLEVVPKGGSGRPVGEYTKLDDSYENATKIPLISYRMLIEFIRTLHIHAKDGQSAAFGKQRNLCRSRGDRLRCQ